MSLHLVHDQGDSSMPETRLATVQAEDAHRVATRADTAVDMERNTTRQRVAQLLVEGRPGRAHYELVRSVMRQARFAGITTADLPVPCPCGGRCCHGTGSTP